MPVNDTEERDKASDKATRQLESVNRPINTRMAVIFVSMGLAIAIAVFFAFKFVQNERQRTLQEWQIRLGIVADSRLAEVNTWLDQNFKVMRELAENASLQLYMSELSAAGSDPAARVDVEAQGTYLRNMLTATAERNGFVPPVAAAQISANVERVGIAGIGLTDAKGTPLSSTSAMPPITGNLRKNIIKALTGEPVLIDAYIGASNLPTIGFVLPVYGIQDDPTGPAGLGTVVGIRVLGSSLFSHLTQPGETAKTAETVIVRRVGNTVQYLSPLSDGTKPLKLSLAITTPDLASAYALKHPGGFAIKRDYAGNDVLVVSRKIANTPWTLIRKIDVSEALAASETRLKTLLTVFVLLIVGVTITIIAVWRHGSSLRAAQAAENFRISSERFKNMSRFMNLISNSQPTAIIAVDANGQYTYVNELAAHQAKLPPEDIIGKTMASVMGPSEASVYEEINAKILKNFEKNKDPDACREQHIQTFGDEEDVAHFRVIKSDHIPLMGDRDYPMGVLMIQEDITALTRERRRSEKMLRQLIDTLLSVVDRRDPFSAHHSLHVAQVSKAIAEEMEITPLETKTVDIAGSLMNLGKIFIPPDLLTKTGNLSDEERKTVTNSYLVSADLLQDVTFEGPVVETIRQLGETCEGTGPLGLKQDDILVTARILAVANAFVAMVSPRAYRDAMTFEKVSNILLEETGTKFDRRSVSALINYLENRGGKEKWAHYRDKPVTTS